MNYNWQSAATPQGRERLEELEKQQLICRIFIAHDDRCEICEMTADKILEWEPSEFEPEMQFLDPDDSNEIAALKAENERMRNALIDIEADARAKLAARLPLNSNETMHSVKHGLGKMPTTGNTNQSGDIGSVIEAIARTFTKDDDFCA